MQQIRSVMTSGYQWECDKMKRTSIRSVLSVVLYQLQEMFVSTDFPANENSVPERECVKSSYLIFVQTNATK